MALFLFYEMICADPKTLEILWRIDDHDPFAVGAYGTFYVDPENNRVLVYSADGSITLLNVSRESGEIITSKKLTMRSETVPAIVGNKIYCRDDEKACYAYKLWE
jgi:outer membrane protein assembly factor BamB